MNQVEHRFSLLQHRRLTPPNFDDLQDQDPTGARAARTKCLDQLLESRIRDIDTILDRVDPDNRIKIIEDQWGDWLKEWKASDTGSSKAP